MGAKKRKRRKTLPLFSSHRITPLADLAASLLKSEGPRRQIAVTSFSAFLLAAAAPAAAPPPPKEEARAFAASLLRRRKSSTESPPSRVERARVTTSSTRKTGLSLVVREWGFRERVSSKEEEEEGESKEREEVESCRAHSID